jgi:hypothetical protein
VDFVDTEMLSPVNGNCDDQYMTVSGSIWPAGFKRICGINPGEYIYFDFPSSPNDSSTLPNFRSTFLHPT